MTTGLDTNQSMDTTTNTDKIDYNKLLKIPENINYTKEGQKTLDELNEDTTGLSLSNIEHTRGELKNTFNLNFSHNTNTYSDILYKDYISNTISQINLYNSLHPSNTIPRFILDTNNSRYIPNPNYTNQTILNPDFNKSPTLLLEQIYSNSSEQSKIDLAIELSNSMLGIYDYSSVDKLGDVSSSDIWSNLKKGLPSGVCRHHHSEVAKFLSSVGFNSGIVTLQKNIRHAITWGKKANGNFFMIDYGKYYEGKDPKNLISKYLASYGSIDFKEYIGDKDGNTLGILQTDLEKIFEANTTVIGTGDILAYSSELAKKGIKITDGLATNTNINDNGSIGVDVKTGNGKYELGVFFKSIKGLYSNNNFINYGINGKIKTGDRKTGFGEVSVGARLSNNEFKSKSNAVLGIDIEATREVYNNGTTRLLASGLINGAISIKNKKIDGTYYNDSMGNTGTTLYLEHNVSSNLLISAGIGLGADIIMGNLRKEDGLKLFGKRKVELGAKYKINEDSRVSGIVSREDGLGYTKTGGKLDIESGKLKSSISAINIDNGNIPFLLSEIQVDIGIKYDITKSISVTGSANITDNGISNHQEYDIGLSYDY